jgi:hypothetical protein
VDERWINPDRVSAAELMLQHAGHHGDKPRQHSYVAIGKPTNWNLLSLPVHQGLSRYLPNFLEELLAAVLDADSYASMNSMFRPAMRYRMPVPSDLPELQGKLIDGQPIPRGFRRSDAISRLNACWVDVDYYKLGLTAGEVIGQIYDRQNEGVIPPPSYLKDSGRGLWVVWLLGMEPRHYKEHVDRWRAMQAKLTTMFLPLGADVLSNDPARVSRILGSLNSKCDKRANLMVFARDTSGEPIRYRLAELADRLGVPDPSKRKKIPTTRKPDGVKTINREKGIRGQRMRWSHDESRFWCLVGEIRKTVPIGTRNAHHLVIGSILRHRYRYELERLPEAIKAAAVKLWKFHPRGDQEYNAQKIEAEITAAAAGTNQQRFAPATDTAVRLVGIRLTAQAIADRLAVTTREAELLRDMIQTSSKGTWPSAQGQEQLAREPNRKEIRAAVEAYLARNAWLMELADQKVADHLAEVGLRVSREFVRKFRRTIAPPKPEATTAPLPFEESPHEGNRR